MKLSPVKSDLEKGAKLGAGSNMLEELQSPTSALLTAEVAIADSEELARAKDNCAWSFELRPRFERLVDVIFFCTWCSCFFVMQLQGRHQAMLGSHIIQHAAHASQRLRGQQLNPRSVTAFVASVPKKALD